MQASTSVESFPSLPDFIGHRIEVWERVKEKLENAHESKPIEITLPDGTIKPGMSYQTTPFEIALGISKSLAHSTIIAKVDDVLFDLHRPLESSCKLVLCNWQSPESHKVFWHSSAHVMGEALECKYGALLCIGPPLDEGFYYDSALPNNKILSESEYPEIEKAIKGICSDRQRFERLEVPYADALEMFSYNKYKCQLIEERASSDTVFTVYRCGPLIDLCRGPHIPDTSYIQAFSLTSNSCAFWKGDVKNDALQRLYGISFPEQKMHKEWNQLRILAQQNDHRLIGRVQDLFMTHPDTPGSCFMLPNGVRICNRLQEMLRTQYRQRGFQEVNSPNIFNIKLWEKSGHWQNYKDNMFTFRCEEQDWALKPMNCPGHCLIFDRKQHSYRDLPIRYADFGVLHRNEFSGALSGLTRVRRFMQDDAHIFCRQDQIQEEVRSSLAFLIDVYGMFGFEFSVELSTMPQKHLGDLETWERAEAALEAELRIQFGDKWKINKGDGAFYGPKIDFHITDALRRSHQCGTIQLDFHLPQRFDLHYVCADDSIQHPVIIHRAILGSIERFFGILIEHTGGKWPFWLSPRQCMVVTTSNKVDDYACQVQKRLFDAGFDCNIDLSTHLLKKKVRDAQVSQYNFIVVIGHQEVEKQTVNVRTRDNIVHGDRTVEQLIEDFNQLVKDRK